LLVGQINLVEPIAQLAASGRPQVGQKEQAQRRMRDVVVSEERAFAGRAAAADYRAQPKDVAKEGVSEYFLFTIEGREDLQDGLSKRLPSFGAKEVPFILTYKHNQRRWGSGIVKFYQLQNDKESKLGDSPLPDGFYQVFREAAGGGLAYVGRHNDKYIPIGEDLEMNLGSDGLLLLEKVRRRYKRINIEYSSYGDVQGWDDAEEWEVVVRNSKREPVPVEIVLQFSGDFDFKPVPATASKWTKNSATEQELRESIPPMSEKRFAYTLVTRQGTNAKK
jgi:hypothetical protein